MFQSHTICRTYLRWCGVAKLLACLSRGPRFFLFWLPAGQYLPEFCERKKTVAPDKIGLKVVWLDRISWA
jgi:hypothetical protein